MLYRMLLHDQCLFLLNFAFLGIFPETAWRVMNCCQATHVAYFSEFLIGIAWQWA